MTIQYEKDARNIVTLTINMGNRIQNVIDDAFIEAMGSAVERLLGEKNLAGVIVTSGKKDFLAGADIDKLYQFDQPDAIFNLVENFKAVLRKLETAGKPVVAALNGTALGGGYETALACHYRILINKPKVKIGLPEVKLGLLPGGGGTQRLPRLIGIQSAMMLMLDGRELKPEQALKQGLVNELVDNKTDLMEKAAQWILDHPESTQPWDQKNFAWPGGDNNSMNNMQLWAAAPSMVNQKTRGNYPAAQYILRCVYEGAWVNFDTASRIESKYFVKTALSKEATNLTTAFWYQLNEIRKGKSRPQGFKPNRVRKVGILGAGMMGAGIAYVSAMVGIEVVLKDVAKENAEKGKEYSAKLLGKRVKKGRMTEEEAEQILGRILPTESAEDLKGCDLIVEAVFEDRDLKAKVTREAEAQIAPEAVFASNTSTLPITGLAEKSERPQNFIGLHFFSPVDKMALVEIIIGAQTSQETLAKAFDFVLQIRKTPIVVNDSRGFYTSRVFKTYLLEGITLLNEGQHPRVIESAGLQAGMPVGPLAVGDEVSLDLIYRIIEQTKVDLERENQKYTPHPGYGTVLKMVNDFKRLGRKEAKGFYEYPKDGKKFLWPELQTHFPPAERKLTIDEMITRLMFVQAIEAVRCYEEKVITSIADVNIGSIFGWGFAPFKGGAIQYVNDYGVKEFYEKSLELAKLYGIRFDPPNILKEMAENNEMFPTGLTAQ